MGKLPKRHTKFSTQKNKCKLDTKTFTNLTSEPSIFGLRVQRKTFNQWIYYNLKRPFSIIVKNLCCLKLSENPSKIRVVSVLNKKNIPR